MPSWKVHRKWSKKAGVSDKISEEVDKLIDFPERWFEEKYPKTYEKLTNGLEIIKITDIFEKDPCIALFGLSLAMNRFGHDIGRKRKWQRDLQLRCIFTHYGIEGVKVAFLHHILDYIETTGRPFEIDKTLKRIKQKLQGTEFDNILGEILSFVYENQIEIMEDVNITSKEKTNLDEIIRGVKGVFVVDNVILPPSAAIRKIHRKVRDEKGVWVEWKFDSYKIRRLISTKSEFIGFILEIKSLIK
ncbi:hypothetical protein JCM16138_06140 [Thermococcus atlanticus]